MNIKIIKEKISRKEIEEIAKEFYYPMIKGVVDIENEIIALGGEWHIDANTVLIEDGSKQTHVWGFNFHLDKTGADSVEYISLINIRPKAGNRSMTVESEEIRKRMFAILQKRIQ